MHYRERAKRTMQNVRDMRVTATVFVEVSAMDNGGYWYNNYSFAMNYVHENQKFQAETERERVSAIRTSHKYLYKNVLYYISGDKNTDELERAIRYYHNARETENISIYRLDFVYAQDANKRRYTRYFANTEDTDPSA